MRSSYVITGALIVVPVMIAATRPHAEAQVTVSTAALLTPIDVPNLLGNGGFEAWSNGSSSMGPVGPDNWYAMGTPVGFFNQQNIRFSRSVESCAGSPLVVAELVAVNPGNFVAQVMENAQEFRGEWVTFSVDIRTNFGLAQPAVEIHDGVGSSQASEVISGGLPFCSQAWTRISVSHLVDPAATTLELRILPVQTIQVNEAMLVHGRFSEANYVPRPNPEPTLSELPLGSIIDWYRINPSVPVPGGFAVADGSVVNDTASPYFGLATPNLSGRFVRGVTTVGAIGTTGGAASVDLAHTHEHPHTHSGSTNSATNAPFHYVDGIPPTPFRCSATNHNHSFTTGSPSNSTTQSALGNVAIEPPYYGLLKLMRIK